MTFGQLKISDDFNTAPAPVPPMFAKRPAKKIVRIKCTVCGFVYRSEKGKRGCCPRFLCHPKTAARAVRVANPGV